MVTMKVDTQSVKIVAANLRGVSASLATTVVMARVGKVLEREIRANISLTDHSLADLAQLDHPYAVKHGGIQIHRKKPWVVHTQSGQLINSLRTAVIGTSSNVRYSIWLDRTVAPHVIPIIKGSQHMLPRNVLWNTATDTNVRRLIMKAAVKVLGKELRSKATVRLV